MIPHCAMWFTSSREKQSHRWWSMAEEAACSWSSRRSRASMWISVRRMEWSRDEAGVQTFLEADSGHVLGVPYGIAPDRRFWNLKKRPDLIERIPELVDCSELRNFLIGTNSPASRFGTL